MTNGLIALLFGSFFLTATNAAIAENASEFQLVRNTEKVCGAYFSFVKQAVTEKYWAEIFYRKFYDDLLRQYDMSLPGRMFDFASFMRDGYRHDFLAGIVGSVKVPCLSFGKNVKGGYSVSSSELIEHNQLSIGLTSNEEIVSTYSYGNGNYYGCGSSFIVDKTSGIANVEKSQKIFWPLFRKSVTGDRSNLLYPLMEASSLLFEFEGRFYFDLAVDLPVGPEFKDEGFYVYELSGEKSREVCFVSRNAGSQ